MDQLLSDLHSAQAALQAAVDGINNQATPVPVNVVDPTWEALKSALEANGWSQIITTTPVEDESAPEDVTEDASEVSEVPAV